MAGGARALVAGALALVAAIAGVEARTISASQGDPPALAGSGGTAYAAAVLMDAASGRVLFEHEAHRRWPPASMTKMMLMLLVAEAAERGDLHWDDRVRTSRWASRMGGSQVYLREGEEFSLAEMMQAIVIHSANDATVAVAEAVGGSADAFVESMNARAAALGLADTEYHSPHGLPPGKGQLPDLSSAYDLAVLARELVKFPQIVQWAGTAEAPFRNGEFTLTNTNQLVRRTNWVDGLKTGFYQRAGFNVAATGERNGLRLIAVVLGVAQKRACFDAAAALLNRGYARYRQVVPLQKGHVVANDVPVRRGKPGFVRVVAGDDLKMLVEKGDRPLVTLELVLESHLEAPLPSLAKVGEVVVKEGDREVGRVPAVSLDAVQRQPSFWERLF